MKRSKLFLTVIFIIAMLCVPFALTACKSKAVPHEHSYTRQNIDVKFLKDAATCKDAATYYYSCSCGARGTETFTSGNPLAHTTGYISNRDGMTHKKYCTVCNTTINAAEVCSGGTATCTERADCIFCGDKHGALAPHTDRYTTHNDGTHKHDCSVCNVAIDSNEACSGGTATCTSKAECELCGGYHGELAQHTIAYTSNSDNTHKKYCSVCNEVFEEHESCSGGTATCSVKATCELCGGKHGELNATNHTDVHDTPAVEETCSSVGYTAGEYCNDCHTYISGHTEIPKDPNKHHEAYAYNGSNTHKKYCSLCEYVFAASDACTGGTATCTEKATCEVCGEKYGELASHTDAYSSNDDGTHRKYCSVCNETLVEDETCTDRYTSNDDGTHKHDCSVCGYVFDDDEACNAVYDPNGDDTHKKYCSRCTYVFDAHEACSGGTATCTVKATCDNCGGYHGRLAPHTGGSYTNNNNGTHNYNSCSVCSRTNVTELHTYSEGLCIRCGDLQTKNLGYTLKGSGADAYYEVDKGTCTATEIHIPAMLNGVPVKSIADNAFASCSSLTSVEIPSSVTSIGEFAFMSCSSLTSVEIPNSVTNIGRGMFQNCPSLTSVNIPSGLTIIDDSMFYRCSSLTSIEIPSSVTSIGRGAFEGCTGLTSIEIPSSVTSIGMDAFKSCTFTSIEIPSSVTSIGTRAFDSCASLTSIVISNGVTSIGSNAFYGCTKLTSIEIPSSVTSIGSAAFQNCTSLTSIEIPSSVTSIGGGAFSNCTSLTNLTIASENTAYKSTGNCLIEIASGTLIQGFNNSVIPDDGSVTSIGFSAFKSCTFTSIVIPSGVTSIGSTAFQLCSSLTSIEIPVSVTSIEFAAFANCPSLTNVYYLGTKEQWDNGEVDINTGGGNLNSNLTNATKHYGEKMPTT